MQRSAGDVAFHGRASSSKGPPRPQRSEAPRVGNGNNAGRSVAAGKLGTVQKPVPRPKDTRCCRCSYPAAKHVSLGDKRLDAAPTTAESSPSDTQQAVGRVGDLLGKKGRLALRQDCRCCPRPDDSGVPGGGERRSKGSLSPPQRSTSSRRNAPPSNSVTHDSGDRSTSERFLLPAMLEDLGTPPQRPAPCTPCTQAE